MQISLVLTCVRAQEGEGQASEYSDGVLAIEHALVRSSYLVLGQERFQR